MADNSLNHLSNLINQQIDYQDDLSDCLLKAEALSKVLLNNDFFDCSDEIKHNYFWALSDIIDSAKMINEKTLSLLFEKKKADREIT
jgi:hypothetical protein